MAIDNPEYLFKPLLGIVNEITYEKYEEVLIDISKGKITQGSTFVEMHMYWLTTLDFLERTKSKGKVYRITDKGKMFLTVYNPNKKSDKYKKFLNSELSRNPRTMEFYEKILESIKNGVDRKNPKTLKEVSHDFPGEPDTAYGTVRVLKMFGIEAGTVIEKNTLLGLGNLIKPKISLSKFYEELVETYKIMQKPKKKWTEPRKIYVNIGKMRDIVLCTLGITDNVFFDENLKKLLESPYGQNIHLYGSAPQWFTTHEKNQDQLVFRHKGKIMVYLSIS